MRHRELLAQEADQGRTAQERAVADRGDTPTRGAANAGSSAPALIPTGKPSDVPVPHSSAPTNASAVPGRTRTGPVRRWPATREQPHHRHAAVAVEQPPDRTSARSSSRARKTANTSVPSAGATWWPSIVARLIQSLPVPSAKAKASTNRPMSSVRGSRHAPSESRALAGSCSPGPRPPWPAGGRDRAGGVRDEVARQQTGPRRPRSPRRWPDARSPTRRSATMTAPPSAADDRAQAEPGVEAGHDRAAEQTLDDGALHVHRHVPGAAGRDPSTNSPTTTRHHPDRGSRPPPSTSPRPPSDPGDHDRASRAESGHDRPRQRQRDHRPGREREQDQPQLRADRGPGAP